MCLLLSLNPTRYEACWPAIMKDVDGVILVYSPEIPSHATEVGIWCEIHEEIHHGGIFRLLVDETIIYGSTE